MAELGQAYVQVVPSAKGIKGSLTNVLGSEADSAGASAGKSIAGSMKKAIGAAAIGTALVGGLTKSITEGANLEQSIGGIETLFKESSDQMIKYADQAYKTAGLSANTYMEQATSFSASLLQSTGGDTKKAAEAANSAIIDMSDNANKMGTNIGDIQNAYQGFAKQNYTMLDNLKLGYGGTKTEMERLLADAEKISGQKYDISNLDDVYAAIHVIQGELGITGTSAKEASTTLSGSFSAMKAAADNFLGDLALGRNIGPAMVALADTASNFLFNNLIPAIGNVFKSLPTAIGAFISQGIPAIKANMSSLLTGLVSGIGNLVPLIAEKLQSIASAAPGFVSALSGVITKGIGAITKKVPQFMAQGAQLLLNLVNGFVKNLPAMATAISDMLAKVSDKLKASLPDFLARGGEILGKLAAGLLKNLPTILAAMARIGLALVKAVVKIIPTMARAGVNILKGFAKGLGSGAAKTVGNVATKIANAIMKPIKAVVSKVKSVANSVKNALNFSSIASKVRSAFNRVKEAIISPIESAKDKVKGVIDKIKGIFPLHIGRIFSGLSLPHISVSGGKAPFGIGGKGSLPSFSVNWYKKAENQPYMFSDATLFGAGERNDEILYGRNALMKDIAEASGGGKEVNIYITNNIDGAEDPTEWADRLSRQIQLQMRTA